MMKFKRHNYKEWWDNGDYTELALIERNYPDGSFNHDFVLCVRGPVHWVHAGCRNFTIDEFREHAALNYGKGEGEEWKARPTKLILNKFERLLMQYLRDLAKRDMLFPGLRVDIKAKPKAKAKAKAKSVAKKKAKR